MKKVFFGFFIMVITFVGLSLINFVPTDRGWANEDTFFQGVYQNSLGVIGAWSSSFLLYYMGGAVWILIFLSLSLCWCSYKNFALSDLFDISMRFLALFFMISTYTAFINCDYVPCIEPGGALGQNIKRIILFLDDYIVEQCVVSILWMACIAFIFPWMYVRVPSKLVIFMTNLCKQRMSIRPKKCVKESPRYQPTIEELMCEVTMQKNE